MQSSEQLFKKQCYRVRCFTSFLKNIIGTEIAADMVL